MWNVQDSSLQPVNLRASLFLGRLGSLEPLDWGQIRGLGTRSGQRLVGSGMTRGCCVHEQTAVMRARGRRWAATAARAEMHRLAVAAGVRRRFAPHHLRHAHVVELAREGGAVNIIQRQHTHLCTTSAYLQGIDPSEIIDAVHSRRPPTISATAGLAL